MTRTNCALDAVELSDIPRVSCQLTGDYLDKFATLLQSGVYLETVTGKPILDLLKTLPGFTESYIDEEVQTIFINGTAIDDVHAPLTEDQTVIAVSASMPGLSGAIFRKNSIHSHLRSVQQDVDADFKVDRITVKVKLFNSIARDQARMLFTQGVNLQTKSLIDYLQTRPWIMEYISRITINQNNCSTLSELITQLRKDGHCTLTITI